MHGPANGHAAQQQEHRGIAERRFECLAVVGPLWAGQHQSDQQCRRLHEGHHGNHDRVDLRPTRLEVGHHRDERGHADRTIMPGGGRREFPVPAAQPAQHRMTEQGHDHGRKQAGDDGRPANGERFRLRQPDAPFKPQQQNEQSPQPAVRIHRDRDHPPEKSQQRTQDEEQKREIGERVECHDGRKWISWKRWPGSG